MNLPENFSGTDGKIGYDEWIRKMELYFAYSNIIADRARLLIALSRLTGTPSIQFKDLAEQVTNDQIRYTWTEFKRKLSGVYGRYDEKLTAKQELDKLAKNTAKAEKDFLTYAEEFRTLAGIAEYSDEHLIDILKNVVNRDMKVGMSVRECIPTDWNTYLETLIDIYKVLYPERGGASIFGAKKKGKSLAQGEPMDVDNVSKKDKKKGKGKEKSGESTNNVGKKDKYCHICKRKGHLTDECYHNSKSSNYKGEGSSKGKKEEKKKEGKTSKQKIRSAEAQDSSDDEPHGSVAVNTAQIRNTPYIEDVTTDSESDDDETSHRLASVSSSKGKSKAVQGRDFL
ncbi:hypothetical protein K435DRAFT_654661 [Dendrothele bispora CBS 962.96]|uniref:Retrotransposon gag domain-containing protein n=1 Tax=Dendrothele bispora (strain CBS 962.96) TaxID=1314807 RepID=A0A4S8MGK1_DENBC|nr:hypothetical protein K435DRAFT_654661 [Dendrothele bispora CBS 962.96]